MLTAVVETCAFIESHSMLVFPLCFQLLESGDFKVIFLMRVHVCFSMLVRKDMKI